MPKNSRKKQNYYKMKGCSKNAKHLGGSSNLVLAYPSKNINTLPNPALAYTGKGGACTNGFTSLSYKPPNIDGVNPTQPSSGPSAGGYNFLNPQVQRGGGCGCGLNMTGGGVSSIMKGGSCSSCVSSFLKGGAGSHRVGCKCSACKNKMKGGSGNNGIPYPNGLVGSAWTPSVGGWPGVKGIGGDNSYLGHNNYNTDISRYMINTNANRPFSIGGGKKKLNKTLKNRKQKGGSFSNFLAQDLINVGRQIQYGLGSAYNGIAGYPQSPSPMPWKGQFQYNSDNTVTIPKKY
jgi:hypothetical protein